MEGEQIPAPLGPGANRSRNIVRGLGSLTIQSVLNAVLGFVLLTSLVRFLSQSDYGAYASVQVSVGIAGAIASLGLGSAVVRFLAPSTETGSQGWGAAKAALYLSVVLSAAAALLFAAAAPFLSDYFLKGPSGAWIFYLGALWLFVSTLDNSLIGLLQGMRRYTLLAKVLLGSRVATVAVAVAGVALYHSLAIALAALTLYGAGVIIAIVPYVRGPLGAADPRRHYSPVLHYAAPLGMAAIVIAIAGSADVVVVGGYLNTGSLAIYNATIQISYILAAFFVAPLVTAFFAETSYSSESEDQVKLGTGLALRFTMMTLLPASFFAATMAPQLFDLFSGGGSYTQGIPYLELITLFYLFYAVEAIAVYVLQGVSRTREVLIIGAVTALGEVGLSASLVPGLGLAGAAYSRVAMFAVGCALSLYFIRRYLPRPADYGFYGKALIASVIPALAVYVPSTLVSDRVITLVPYTILGVALFATCAKALRLLSPDDKAYLGHLLPASLHWVLRFL